MSTSDTERRLQGLQQAISTAIENSPGLEVARYPAFNEQFEGIRLSIPLPVGPAPCLNCQMGVLDDTLLVSILPAEGAGRGEMVYIQIKPEETTEGTSFAVSTTQIGGLLPHHPIAYLIMKAVSQATGALASSQPPSWKVPSGLPRRNKQYTLST